MNETTARKLAQHLVDTFKQKEATRDRWDRGHYWGVVRGAAIITDTNPDQIDDEVCRVARMLNTEAVDTLTIQLLMAFTMVEVD